MAFYPFVLYAWSGPPNKLNLVTLLEAQFAAISLRLPRARPKSAVSGIRARIGRDGDGRTEQKQLKRQRQQRKEVGRMAGKPGAINRPSYIIGTAETATSSVPRGS